MFKSGLTSNELKIIGAVTMAIDHIGLMFFPDIVILRIIGRLAFPIFAYMIAEGCRYTKNKPRYFFGLFSLAVICQVCYQIADNSVYMSILVTFSLSILVIYALQYLKRELFKKNKSILKICLRAIMFLLSVLVVWILNKCVQIDYGFWGSMVPVFVSVFQPVGKDEGKRFRPLYVCMLLIGLIILSYSVGWIQIYSLLAIPLMLLYNGERGKYKMKYFFYIFYPLHLVILQGIYMIIK